MDLDPNAAVLLVEDDPEDVFLMKRFEGRGLKKPIVRHHPKARGVFALRIGNLNRNDATHVSRGLSDLDFVFARFDNVRLLIHVPVA